MTLPDERTRAVLYTRNFLTRLVTREIKRVPLEVRKTAQMLLRHYPHECDFLKPENSFAKIELKEHP